MTTVGTIGNLQTHRLKFTLQSRVYKNKAEIIHIKQKLSIQKNITEHQIEK